ncbi:hypothetical protein SDC9_193071 [bioreactor metagenome]|uniref:Carbohydrate kinase PfkB domain-containing protein n=1 Tax=bioreactor metagenome TaxID=1076179 RepID=A0A645IB05_9ZZZZ
MKLVAVTLGAKGAFIRVRSESRLVPGFRSNAIDTTGAGDAFFGGFLYRFLCSEKALKDITLEDAADYARFGNATASLCVEQRGGIPAMPILADILCRIGE